MDKDCAVFNATNLVGKKWTLNILLELYKGDNKWKRYHMLKEKLPMLTPKILSTRLKEMDKQGLLTKKVDSSTVPIKSEYSLTKRGEEFITIIKSIKTWNLKNSDGFKRCKNQDCKNCAF